MCSRSSRNRHSACTHSLISQELIVITTINMMSGLFLASISFESTVFFFNSLMLQRAAAAASSAVENFHFLVFNSHNNLLPFYAR